MIVLLTAAIVLYSCEPGEKKAVPANFIYQAFKDSINAQPLDSSFDNQNIFDSSRFIPAMDTTGKLLKQIDSMWHREIDIMEQVDTLKKLWKKTDKFTPEEMEAIKENVKVLDSFLFYGAATEHSGCTKKDCIIFADIIKSRQTLYLYLDGTLIDSFKVSTGIKKYETPNINVRPSGPLFTKYKSRKFPGGNYMGMGNMPYAVFIRGGYAIHGTTTGNFAKLGTRASHGCIRLHPTNARIFYELVKRIGIKYTWVTVRA